MSSKKNNQKKSEKAGKDKKATTPVVTEEMMREQLKQEIFQLREEIQRERKEMSNFKNETQNILTYWEISKDQFRDLEQEIRNGELHNANAEVKHLSEIGVYKKKFENLLYDQSNSLSDVMMEISVATKLLTEEHMDAEDGLHRDVYRLTIELREQEFSMNNLIRNLKLSQEKRISKLRNNFEGKIQDIIARYERKMEKQRAKQDLHLKSELQEVEKKKHIQMNMQLQKHENAFNDINSYYNNIIENELNKIETLKEQVDEKISNQAQLEKGMSKVLQERKSLTEQLEKTTQELSVMQKALVDYHKNKGLLAKSKACIDAKSKERLDLKVEHEVMLQRVSMMEEERDALCEEFEKATREVEQKSAMTNLFLETKLEALKYIPIKEETPYHEILTPPGLESDSLPATRKTETKSSMMRPYICPQQPTPASSFSGRATQFKQLIPTINVNVNHTAFTHCRKHVQ